MPTGERIKAIRKKSGLSQIELAEKAGIAVNSLRLYEAGKREPKIDAITKLAGALGVTKQELLGWARDPDAIDEATLNLYPGYDPSKETISEYLTRKEKEKDPESSQPARPEVTDEDIKFALFDGAGEITDEMFEEVKRFARFVQQQYNNGNV